MHRVIQSKQDKQGSCKSIRKDCLENIQPIQTRHLGVVANFVLQWSWPNKLTFQNPFFLDFVKLCFGWYYSLIESTETIKTAKTAFLYDSWFSGTGSNYLREAKRSRSWRLMSTSSCELCRDLSPWCSCRAPQTEFARDVWCWLFKPFGRSRHFCWL